jgi:hypothetical protein
MLLLHRNVGSLAKIAAKDSGRFAMCGVRVSELPDNHYRVEATDGKLLARVEGENEKTEDYPDFPALTNAPNGATSGTIPAKSLDRACKGIVKRTNKPILQRLAIIMSDTQATLASTDLESVRSDAPRLVEGRWPSTDSVFPNQSNSVYQRWLSWKAKRAEYYPNNYAGCHRFGELYVRLVNSPRGRLQADQANERMSVKFNATILAKMLTISSEFADNDCVTITFYDGGRPALIECQNTEQQFRGLVMPLT